MKRICRYTLVELLVVVAIAAVILGVATPAFSVMMKGGAMTSSTRELAAKIKAARSYAVTNNSYVAVVFPTEKDWSGIRLSMNSCVYRPCLVYRDANGDWFFDTWIDGEQWSVLNKGIAMIPHAGGTTDPEFAREENLWNGGTTQAVKSIRNVPLGPLKDISKTDDEEPQEVCRAIIFKPNGQLADVDVGEQLRFRLIEGTVIRSGADVKAMPTSVFTEGSKTYLIAKTFAIHPLTCRMKIEDFKFEWDPSGSSLGKKAVD